MKRRHKGLMAALAASAGLLGVTLAGAPDCDFTTRGNTIVLQADCVVSESVLVPDGFTLDGRNNSITAVDPESGNFVGAVVRNEGSTAHVTNLTVQALNVDNSCKGGTDRLRGIMFEGASGSITHNNIVGINKGASGCQEGNGIEVRNGPFDGTHPNTQRVEIAHNTITGYQKTGIVANGDVDVNIHHNQVGESSTQQNLAANSIQMGFGAQGEVTQNQVDGNQWLGASNFAATAILVFNAPGTSVDLNNVRGNSDVGIFVIADDVNVDNNKVFDNGADGPHGDWGIANIGSGSSYTNNKIRGFLVPTSGIDDLGTNKFIRDPRVFD